MTAAPKPANRDRKRPGSGPERRCVSCRAGRPRSELLRVLRRPAGGVALIRGGHADGRSAYICRNRGCISAAVEGPRLERALRTPIPAAVLAELEAEEAA